ncbi:conserved membrane hypothetical protein [Frankia canadensis]|uniref:Acid-resistance membrane protein n=1 Tax=Frankia canadensis TaxID=1836972 RepID=A0A2I2KMK9_9ACTN|nr:DUF308 domain-containing protein [Frankia canadensis]SNQ46889.1 conserved membrane hypothetical protein [Frankia canadensis]SOU54179.1 conserved membrane hypothetical protein [Frankia canadensis]
MATIYRQQRDSAPSALWPALVLLGVAVTVLGLLLITNPFATAGALAALAGVALVLSGISETIAAARAENVAGAALFGILLVLGGIVILLWPGATLRVVALVVGSVLIVTGAARAILIRRSRAPGGGGRNAPTGYALAALSVVLGVLALVWPGATIVVLAILFGIQLIVTGVAETALGLALRPHGRHA